MTLKRALWVMLVAFAIFFLVSAPVEAAGIVRATGETLASALQSLTQFVRAL